MYGFCKRVFDIIASLVALVMLLPLLLLICIILVSTGEHEVFYLQERIGYKCRKFYIWKFATMVKNSPNIGTGVLTMRKDPRVLPFGRFLRRSKLNELPQLVNVLKGDMSVVGPRPMVETTFEAFPEAIRYKIYDSYPGLSGVGSIIFRDEEDYISRARDPRLFYNKYIQSYKAELEAWYGENQSFKTDLRIILLTLWGGFSKKNHLIYRVFKTLPRRDMEKELSDFNQYR
jgi:lipopolysaccharide/colanic/teichoic acid biosynthesis glycosyltransferase